MPINSVISLVEVEETSFTLSWSPSINSGEKVQIEYKTPYDDWADAKVIDATGQGEAIIPDQVAILNLEPGTPYIVRLKVGNTRGPETVFDTMPVGCTPKHKKKKKCIIM